MHLVRRIFGMQEAGEQRYISQSHVPGIRRIGFRCPSHRGLCADLRFTSLGSEASKCTEIPRGVVEFKTEGLPKRDIAFDVGDQHDATPGHGWAISDSRSKSTLA